MENLGTMPLSTEILNKANIGFWAFELDEGKPPRMYADEAMLGLVGLKEQIAPEDIYHAWYDHIDPDHYAEVAASVEKMTAGEHAEVQYPWHYPDGRTITVRCGGVRNFAYTKGIRIEGTHQDVTAIAHIQKEDEEIRQLRNMEIIRILASEYSSVYYIDLTTDELNPYTMNAETESEFGQIFNSGITYSEAFRLYVDRLIHPEDKAMMLRSGSVENIREQLAGKKTFLTQYRSADGRYSEMKFVKVGDEDAEPVAVALGFADKDEEIQKEKQNERNREIIEILASEYTSVYYIDLTTDELTPYTMNEETENQFGVLFKFLRYSEAYRMYVDTLIYPEDKAMMLQAGSVGNIMKELRTKKTFLTTYRSADGRYCEMKFVKVGDEEGTPKAVALGFADKDDELRSRIEQSKVQNRNQEIIEILASEYTSVYYIDLTTEELDPYTMNEETETEFGHIFRSGISYSEAYRMYVDTLVYPEDRKMMLQAGSVYNILKELQDKKTYLTTYRSDNNGDPHYCEMKFVKVGEDENPSAVALGFADKDEAIRKEMEERAEREKNFEIIDILASEYTSVYYIDLNTDGLTPYSMNDATAEYFGETFHTGIPYSEAFRMYVDKAVAEQSREDMMNAGSIENIRRKLRRQKTFITAYLNEMNLYCEMKFVKVGDEDGEPQAVALGFSVVDEAYRAELARKQQEEFINGLADDYEVVFHANPAEDTIEIVRLSDTFLQRNPRTENDRTYSDFLLRATDNVIEEDQENLLAALSVESLNCEFGKDYVFFHNYRIRKDGRECYYQLKLIRTGDWKTDFDFLIGVHNVDELMRAQAEQEKSMEEARKLAESANRAKSTFLFNMSHDIRTPMNAIRGYTRMAKKYSGNPDQVRDYLDKIDVAGEQLLSLINQVLEMSRIESGKVVLAYENVDVEEKAGEIITVAAADVETKGLKLVVDIGEIRNRNVLADITRINQVLVNIIGNAVKYTPEGGTITYSVHEHDYDRTGWGLYEFCVSDTGIGMSEEFLKNVFDEFARENTSTVSKIQGTGLGMSIVKRLVDLMGGNIEISSKKGKGTAVRILLPLQLNEAAGKAAAKEELRTVSLEGLKVLLVEDNEMNREIALDILGDSGIIASEAEDGDIAVEKVKNSSPGDFDLILMDIQMPRMNGYEATRAIRALPDPALASIPIVAMTANAFEEDRKAAFAAGMNEHLAKPIDIAKLRETLARFM